MTDFDKQPSQDEKLSDFADHVLKGQMKNTASDSTEELRGLEETILRLHNTMPSAPLEESTKKQMLVRLNARIRREKEQPQRQSFWAGLFNQPRSRFVISIGIIAILIIAVVISPALSAGSSSTVGTALNSNSSVLIVVGLVALIIGILCFTRRK